jgi:glutamyl-tRNA synthetase
VAWSDHAIGAVVSSTRRAIMNGVMHGRFAPSPTGALHLGNLRTALLAWLYARAAGSSFTVRMEDLDPVVSRVEHEQGQLADLVALGLDWDGAVVRQSERRHLYDAAIDRLTAAGLTYPCYCSRREIAEASSAPNGAAPDGAYPGTCRELSDAERSARERAGRTAALRLRSTVATISFVDGRHGPFEGVVDDLVLRRRDGVAAYNLAVVVDDAAQGIEQVVRADDLLASTPRQLHLADVLGLPRPQHAHVPLVLAPDGSRLAKRHGAVTLADRAAAGEEPAHVLARLGASLGLCREGESMTAAVLLERFDPSRLPTEPWTVPAAVLA